MTDELTPDRFRMLCDSYGGTIVRWPQPVRVQAQALATHAPFRMMLVDAQCLDELLDSWSMAPPPVELRARILAKRPRPLIHRLRLWWAGLGIATALAGAAMGSVAAASVVPADRYISEEATAFGNFVGGDN